MDDKFNKDDQNNLENKSDQTPQGENTPNDQSHEDEGAYSQAGSSGAADKEHEHFSEQESPLHNLTDDEEPVTEKYSEVAGVTGNKKIAIAVIIAVAIGALFMIFISGSKTPAQIKVEERERVESKKEEIAKTSIPVQAKKEPEMEYFTPAPKALEPPPIKEPSPPKPPPAPEVENPTPPAFPDMNNSGFPEFPSSSVEKSAAASFFGSNEEEEARKRDLLKRRKSSIMVVGGGGSGKGSEEGDGAKGSAEGEKSTDKSKKKDGSAGPFLGFGDGTLNEQVLSKTSSEQISATYIGRLDSTIAQGKIIDAVLETAINSDLPGTLRAIVSRDVYAESGKAVLIPKGSRVIGTYGVSLKPGQTRVNVVWDRLIRPDGLDLALSSPGTDALGRSGVGGYVDDKILAKLGTAFLISYLIPTVTNKLANVNDKSITSTSTTNTDGSTSTTTSGGNVGSSQLQESSKEFKDIATKALEDSFNEKSTIFVDQGTKINIFANKDIVFPPQVALKSVNSRRK